AHRARPPPRARVPILRTCPCRSRAPPRPRSGRRRRPARRARAGAPRRPGSAPAPGRRTPLELRGIPSRRRASGRARAPTCESVSCVLRHAFVLDELEGFHLREVLEAAPVPCVRARHGRVEVAPRLAERSESAERLRLRRKLLADVDEAVGREARR